MWSSPVTAARQFWAVEHIAKRRKLGRPAVLKLFRARAGKQEASHEIEQYRALDLLKGMDRQWFPAFMGGDAAAAPFPWTALAFAGKSLGDHLRAHGPLPQEALQPFTFQAPH